MLRNKFSDEPLRRILDGMVHASAAGDPAWLQRHRDFIAAHLAAGLLALVALTAFLVMAGRPSPAVAFAFLWLATPLPIAAFLSKTGRFAAAHLLSAAAFAAFLAYVSVLSGGLGSPALVWLLVLPAGAVLAGSGRVTAAASLGALAALAVTVAATTLGLAAPPPSSAVGLAIFAGAVLYAALLAIRIGLLHRRAEQRSRDGEGRYRLLADNATDLITRHSPGGAIEFASPAARAITGCPPSELIGDGLFHRVHVADRPAFLRALSEADRTGLPVTAEFRLRRDDRGPMPEYVWLEMRCRPAVDPADARRTIVAVTRDVTARKDYELAFEDARAEAEAASRAKSQFLANMSHELRTPLNAIIGFSDVLRQLPESGDPAAMRTGEYAELIHDSGEHLLAMVNSILDMSKIEAGRLELSRERFAIGPVVDGAVAMLSHQIARRGLKLVRTIERDLPEIVADRRACRQMLLNLIANAVKFTEPGGRIAIAARLERGSLVLEVADDGIGIAAADLPRIGMPFEQADADYDRRYEGTGLGLSVVKGLVALHGGTVSIASTLGRGTTVTIRLPAGIAAEPHSDEERERKIA